MSIRFSPSQRLLIPPSLQSPIRRAKEEEIKVELTNRIVLQHAQRSVDSWSNQGLVVAGEGHGDQAHGDGSRFGYRLGWLAIEQLTVDDRGGAYVSSPFWVKGEGDMR